MFFQNFWCITWESLSQVPDIVQPLANIVEFKVPNRRWLSLQLCPRYQTSRRFHHVVDLWPCGKVESFARWNFERKADLLGDISANAARGKPLRLFSMYTGWGTAEMVASAVSRVFKSLKGTGQTLQARHF